MQRRLRRTVPLLPLALVVLGLGAGRRLARAESSVPYRHDKALLPAPEPQALVLGERNALVVVEPESGKELGRAAPLDVPGLEWVRFYTSGRFLLAEGVVGDPARSPKRALALLDGIGRLRWTATHTLDARTSRAVYLNEDGVVVHDADSGGRVIIPSGAVTRPLAAGAVPLGPVVGDALLLGGRTPWSSTWDIGATSLNGSGTLTDLPPDLPGDKTQIVPSFGHTAVVLWRVLRYRPKPETDPLEGATPIEVVGRVPLPKLCATDPRGFEATLSPRYYRFDCGPKGQRYLLDVEGARFTPASSLLDTVAPDGSLLAMRGDACEERVLRSRGGKPFATTFRLPWGLTSDRPDLVCGHVMLDVAPNLHCHRSQASPRQPKAFVEQRDGRWVALTAGASGDICSADGRVAFLSGPNESTTVAVTRLDRDEPRSVKRPGLDWRTPLAWFPPR